MAGRGCHGTWKYWLASGPVLLFFFLGTRVFSLHFLRKKFLVARNKLLRHRGKKESFVTISKKKTFSWKQK